MLVVSFVYAYGSVCVAYEVVDMYTDCSVRVCIGAGRVGMGPDGVVTDGGVEPWASRLFAMGPAHLAGVYHAL